MFISLKELERDRVEFSTTFDPGALDFRGAELEQPSPLVFVGSAELIEGEIRVRGHLEGSVRHGCDRCLGPVEISVEKELDLFYRPLRTIAREEEVEISENESEVSFFSGEGVELKDFGERAGDSVGSDEGGLSARLQRSLPHLRRQP